MNYTLTIKIDDKGRKKLRSRLTLRMLGGGDLSPPEFLWAVLLGLEPKWEKYLKGETLDLTEEAGKLQKLLDAKS